jgi:FlaG/FlaF family flagellin (archaellin)
MTSFHLNSRRHLGRDTYTLHRVIISLVLLTASSAGCNSSHEQPLQAEPARSQISAPQFAGSLSLPFSFGETWYVCRGYNGASHTGHAIFGLDLTPDRNSKGNTGCIGDANAASGKLVRAPADGTAQRANSSDFVVLNLDAGGQLLIGHVVPASRFVGRVSRGDSIGKVAGRTSTNGNYAHIHIHMLLKKSSVPFADSHGTRFTGSPDLPDIGSTNQHSGTALRHGSPVATPSLSSRSTSPSSPVAGQQFSITLNGSNFTSSNVEIVFTGPGCSTTTACVVPNAALNTRTSSRVVGPVRLNTAGTYDVRVRNGAGTTLSNAVQVTIAAASRTPSLSGRSTSPSSPVAGQQFSITLNGSNFTSSNVEIVFTGPGCSTTTACVVPNAGLNTKTSSRVVGPVRLNTAGTYDVRVRNGAGATLSNAVQVTIGRS